MFAFVVAIHAIACVFLILIVLIQQGKGGGLIDSVSSAESIFGTKTNTFLIKATSVLSVIFFITCLSLAFLSIQKSKSLIDTYRPGMTKTSVPKTAQPIAASTTAKTTPAVTTQTTTVPKTAASTAPIQASTTAAPQSPQTPSAP